MSRQIGSPVLLDPNNVVNGVRQPLPGNKIPPSLLNPDARALMNVMPLPNLTDLTGIQYNYMQREHPQLLGPSSAIL